MRNDFILDEDFEGFLEDFGDPISSEPVSSDTLSKYQGKLPERLLEYWNEFGFCGFKDGLFWIVNPDDYDEILDEWIDETAIPEKDAYHVIARSAFGDLFIWGEKTGYKYRLLCNRSWLIEQNGDEKYISKGRSSFAMEVFFGGMDVDSIDLKDSDDNSLFLQYMKKFSPLKSDEVLAFEPTIFLGGEANINTIQKANVFVHLSVLAQFGNLEILDDKALMMKAFD